MQEFSLYKSHYALNKQHVQEGVETLHDGKNKQKNYNKTNVERREEKSNPKLGSRVRNY